MAGRGDSLGGMSEGGCGWNGAWEVGVGRNDLREKFGFGDQGP